MHNMNETMVSVICTTYNHEKYIRSALDGFVMQKTNFKFEVLVHDDASTDSTADIIREYAEKYPDIIKPIFEKENQYSQGINFVRTIIFPLVKGKYMAYCEGDDYWIDSLKLQKQVDFLEGHKDYSMCACSCHCLDLRTNKILPIMKKDIDVDVPVEEIISEKQGRIFQTATVVIRSDINKLFPKWRMECPVGDYPMFINAGIHGKIRMLASAMSVYRLYSAGSWSLIHYNDNQYWNFFSKQVDKTLIDLNVDTIGKYYNAIQERREMNCYQNILRQRNLYKLISFKPKFLKITLKERISYILQFSCPSLYKCLRSVYHLFK